MAALDQNLLYIIIAVVVVVIIILAVLLRRRGSKGVPSNTNQYLTSEAEHKKARILERETGFKTKIPLYMRKPEDDLNDFKEEVSNLQHKNIYGDSKIKDKLERLTSRKVDKNLKKQLNAVHKKDLELSRIIKPKEDK